MDVNQHYAALLGLGDEWTETDGALDVENFRTVILSSCGKLDLRPAFVRIGATP